MHLIATLGSSFAVVPEAYLMGNGDAHYTVVNVLATSGIQKSVEQCKQWFSEHATSCQLDVYIIEGLDDIANGDDHAHYEEALFRCYFHALSEAESITNLDICLAGGFKTISSAAHQTADLLGCRKLFHITSPFGERFDDHESILRGIEKNKLNLVDLGSRPGWPTIQQLQAEAPPIPGSPLKIGSTPLRDKIFSRLREANQLSQSEHELATLPFPQIARWSPSQRDWLEQPLTPDADADWIAALPKIELHCHLGGFATHGYELDTVRNAASYPERLPPIHDCIPPEDWPLPTIPYDLEKYRKLGDNNGSGLLKDPGCLRMHIQLLCEHLAEQNVYYAEIRCSPANYAAYGRSPWDVLTEIKQAFDDHRSEHLHISLIIIATRQSGGDFRTHISRHLALASTAAEHWTLDEETRVVGVDLAGYESEETRAHYFREEFTAAHRMGLGITIHAGENDDAEGIWSAIINLNTRRVGHALRLLDSRALLQTVADRRIGVEMCPYANHQIVGFPLDPTQPNEENYPLLKYLDKGVPVTINTDNIGISAASLTENFLLLPRLCPGIKRIQILQLLRNSVEQSFLSVAQQHRLLGNFDIAPVPTKHK